MEEYRAQIWPSEMMLYCDMYLCTEFAAWHLGRPDGPLNNLVNLCDKCKNSIVESLNIEQKEIVAPKTAIPDAVAIKQATHICSECLRGFTTLRGLELHIQHRHKKAV